jgi:hypothetical protein
LDQATVLAVPVAGPVVRRRAEDAVRGQRLGDREESASGQVFAENPSHHRRGDRVRFEAV